jgi:signal transduction histidine kinase
VDHIYPVAVRALRRLLLDRRDRVLAAALFVLGLAELVLGERYQGGPVWPGPTLAAFVEVAVLTLPLAVRRSRPLLSNAVVMGAVIVFSLAWGAVESTAGFLAMLVSVFSGTAYARRPSVVLAISVAALTVHNLEDPTVTSPVDWFWSAGFLAVAVLLGGAVRTRQLKIFALEQDADEMAREYDERVATATAEERAAIARELHDIVAHAVSVIVVQAQAGIRSVDDDPATTRMLLETIESTGRSAMDDLRRLLTLLSTTEGPVDPSPGLRQLCALVDGFRQAGVQVSMELPDPLPQLSAVADLAAYRIVQEALTNTVRHARGARANVQVRLYPTEVEVIVSDEVPARTDDPEGTVRTPVDVRATAGTGRGLIGMRERVRLAGGTLVECGPTGHGFRVHARLPVDDRDLAVAGTRT